MLMIQSSVSASVLGDDEQRPSAVLSRVNSVLESNIRRRLKESEHATLLVLRLHSDGHVVMAGAHEEVIVHRRSTGKCEELVEANAAEGPAAIVDSLIAKVHAWTPLQQDDITVLALWCR